MKATTASIYRSPYAIGRDDENPQNETQAAQTNLLSLDGASSAPLLGKAINCN